jgi:hypothetical protein
MAITVNWATDQIINIPKADMTLVQLSPVEIRELDTDSFFLTLKDLESSIEGIPWPNTQRNASPVLLGGITYARVLEIIDPYTVTFEDGTYVVQLTGSNNNLIERTNPNQVSVQGNNAAGLIQTQEIQYSSFQGGVTIDQANGTAGQAYPAGTRQSPVNNLTDAKFIADLRGFDKFFVKGTFTFDVADTIDGFELQGESFTRTVINLTSAATIENCKFSNAAISGSLDGGNDVFSCRVGSLDYIDGVIYDSELEVGTITLGGTQADFVRCYSGVAGGGPSQTPVLDLGGTGTSLVIRDYHGGLTLTNYTSGTDPASIDLSSGRITFDSTISAGQFAVRGVGFVEDNSTGTAIIKSQILDANQINLANYEGSVWIDPSTSNTGTEYPVGSPAAPVNNGADAQTIATQLALYNLTIRGNTTITSTHTNMKFWGRSPRTTQLTIDSAATLSGCEFELLLLTGDLSSNGSSYFITVALKDVAGVFGHLEGCVLREGTNTINTFVMLNKCAAVSAVNPGTDIPILDCNGDGRIAARSLDGEIIIQNKTSGNDCSLHLEGAVVTLTSTITAGTWRFHGVGTVINQSGGTAVIDTTDLVSPQSVAAAVGDNAKIVDIFRRLDLDAAAPNTHKNDNTEITNSEFDLTTSDNGDGTYTVTRTNNP